MSKITLRQAVDLVPVSRSKLYKDKDKVFSTEKNPQGTIVVDPAELERVYGKLKIPPVESTETEKDVCGHPETANESSPQQSKIVQELQKQVSTLESQLTEAAEREKRLIVKEDKLLEMLQTEQEKTRLLMLTSSKSTRSGNIMTYFRNLFTPSQTHQSKEQ